MDSIEEIKPSKVDYLKLNYDISEDEFTIRKISQHLDKIARYDEELTPSYKTCKNTSLFKFYDKYLSKSQQASISEILSSKSYKIVGPPGTGKTRTVIELLSQLLLLKQRVLVAGPSNITIDNIIERFLSSKYFVNYEPTFYRLGSSIKGLTKYNLDSQVLNKTDFVEREKNERNFKRNLIKLQKKYKTDLQEEAKVVFATLFSSLKETSTYDWVIIDEACQATDVESFLCLMKGKRFILIGDPNQLCPKKTSLFEKLSLDTHFLNLQYRMCHNLIQFSNEMFYDRQILSHLKSSINFIEDSPLVFIDTDCSDYNETDEEKSKKNQGESDIICKVVEYIEHKLKSEVKKDNFNILKSIGIITPYSAQAALLRNLLSENIEVKTVDGFQGREKDYIILSLVRSNNVGDFGFLDDYKRLNVAITRSRKGLVVVGNSQNFRKSNLFSNFSSL